METKAALYRTALQQVGASRRRAQDIAQENRDRLCQAVPEYEPLRLQLLNTEIELARQAALGQPLQEVQARVNTLHDRLQAMLKAAGVSPDSLQPQYQCPDCQDTGVCRGQRCACVERAVRRLRRQQINREFPLDLCSFEGFSLQRYPQAVDATLGTSPRAIMTQVLEYCQAYAAHFRPGAPSLLLMGDAGLGKTHLALAIAGSVLDKGYDVVYVSAQQAFAALDDTGRDSAAEAWLEAMLTADLLVLDDLGTEYVVPHTISMLYQLVNTRLSARHPTVYTTNIMTQPLLNARYTEKVASRLLGGCEILQFFGEDLRLQGK